MAKFLGLVLFLALSGCGQAMNNFVLHGAVNPEPASTPTAPVAPVISTTSASSNAIKVSPGAMNSSGSQVTVKAHVTPTGFAASGNHISARLSLSQNRAN